MATKKYRSKKGMERLTNTIIYIILTVMSVVWLIPFVILIIQSFRGELGGATPYCFPKEWTLNNYVKLFTKTKFLTWYGNTLLVSVVVTVVQTLIVLATSYALSRLRFKMRKPLMNLVLILGMFPGFLSMTAKAMTDTEVKTLAMSCFALTAELATRFLADYLDGDPYFNIKYPEHNRIRTRCQIALAKDMLKHMEEMEQIVHDCAGKWR